MPHSYKRLFLKIPSVLFGLFYEYIYPFFLEIKVEFLFLFRRCIRKNKHGLSSLVFISLTSYPARFKKLHLTVKSLLLQSVSPDEVILWISHQDKECLPKSVLVLQKYGLTIKFCKDLKSYKKIIPLVLTENNNFIVTADDDVYYWNSWLKELISCYESGENGVVSHRAHRIRLNDSCIPLPYTQWYLEVQSPEASTLNFQTGVGGVLYPPGSFHSDVANEALFNQLCPQADDVWLYWMIRLNGLKVRCPVISHRIFSWKNSQKSALFHANVKGGGNDRQIKMMVNKYGFPL